jgi:AraC-like DNA-binding protein
VIILKIPPAVDIVEDRSLAVSRITTNTICPMLEYYLIHYQIFIDTKFIFVETLYVHASGFKLNLYMLSDELAISERRLFRRIKTLMGITPNRYIRVIRLQLAKEAIKSGRFRTVAEVSYAVGLKLLGI